MDAIFRQFIFAQMPKEHQSSRVELVLLNLSAALQTKRSSVTSVNAEGRDSGSWTGQLIRSCCPQLPRTLKGRRRLTAVAFGVSFSIAGLPVIRQLCDTCHPPCKPRLCTASLAHCSVVGFTKFSEMSQVQVQTLTTPACCGQVYFSLLWSVFNTLRVEKFEIVKQKEKRTGDTHPIY